MAIERSMHGKTGSRSVKIVSGLIIAGTIFWYAPYKDRIAIFLVFLLLLGLCYKLGQGIYDRWLNPHISLIQSHLLQTPLPYLLIFYAVTHFPFVFSVFGEPDSINIATGILDSVKNSSYEHLLESPLIYNKGISFGYYLFIISILKIFHIPTSHLVELMNYLNVLIGMFLLIPLYKVLESLFGKGVAFFSTVILSMVPSFWLSTTSGHPHLVAFFFFILALYLLDKALQKDTIVVLYYISAILSWVVALSMKADMILVSLVFLGMLYWKEITTRRNILWGMLFILLSTGLFILLKTFLLWHDSSGEQNDAFFLLNYLFGRFFGITLPQSLPPVMTGAGLATFILAVFCSGYYWIKNEYRLLIFGASWFVMPTFFWLLLIHNSARHNMMYVTSLLIIIVHYIYHHHKKYLLPLSTLIIVGNYFLVPPGGSSFNPSGRLWWDYVNYQEIIQKEYLTPPLQVIRSPESQIYIVVLGYNPGYMYHLLASMDHYQLQSVLQRRGTEETIILRRVKNQEKDYIVLNILNVQLNLPDTNSAIISKAVHDVEIFGSALIEEDQSIRDFYLFVGSAPGWIPKSVAMAVRDHLERNGYRILGPLT